MFVTRTAAQQNQRAHRDNGSSRDPWSLREQIALPPHISCARWVATNLKDFHESLERSWKVISGYQKDFRPGEGFPQGVQYYWPSDNKSTLLSAPMYVDNVLQWTSRQLQSFPNDQENEFAILCGRIIRRLFRVYAIIFSSFLLADMEYQLKSGFKHFIFFCTEFGLLSEREVEPVQHLVDPVRQQYYVQGI